MPIDDHLRAEQYVETRKGRRPGSAMALRLHDHLVQVCPECGSAWELLEDDRDRLRMRLRQADFEAPADGDEADHHLPAFLDEADALRGEISELRNLRRRVLREAWELERQSPEERIETVDKARRRFRSAALAEHLIDRIRERVRSDPRDAESLATLIPRILHWAPADTDADWIAELLHRAAAWRANALRVAGDLPAADRAFATLRRDMAHRPVRDVGVMAEAASLEASLRIGQRRFAEAQVLLDRALLLYREIGDEVQVGRTLILVAQMQKINDREAAALESLESASARLSAADAQPYDLLCAANGRVTLLLTMERFREAEVLLRANLDLYESSQELHVGPYLRNLRGRIALGLGQSEKAKDEFEAALEGLVTLGRSYDATVTALDLAQTYLDLNQISRFKPLVVQVLEIFRSQGVARESLAALKILMDAISKESLTKEIIAKAKSRIINGKKGGLEIGSRPALDHTDLAMSI